MKYSETKKTILLNLDGKSRASASDLGEMLGIPAGPASRAAGSLVDHGALKVIVDKEGVKRYARTAEGSKIAKKL
jgi:predicted transcriptional regulator with HTH domain